MRKKINMSLDHTHNIFSLHNLKILFILSYLILETFFINLWMCSIIYSSLPNFCTALKSPYIFSIQLASLSLSPIFFSDTSITLCFTLLHTLLKSTKTHRYLCCAIFWFVMLFLVRRLLKNILVPKLFQIL